MWQMPCRSCDDKAQAIRGAEVEMDRTRLYDHAGHFGSGHVWQLSLLLVQPLPRPHQDRHEVSGEGAVWKGPVTQTLQAMAVAAAIRSRRCWQSASVCSTAPHCSRGM